MKLVLGNRKFIVAMTALIIGGILGLTCEAAVVSAYALLASATVTTFFGAHAVADSKWSRPGDTKPPES